MPDERAQSQARKEVYRLVIEPGLWRDYSTFSAPGCTVMQWFRFYHNRLRKIGGVKWIGSLNSFITTSSFNAYNSPYGNINTQPSYPAKQYIDQDLSQPYDANANVGTLADALLLGSDGTTDFLIDGYDGTEHFDILLGGGGDIVAYDQYDFNNILGPNDTPLPATFYDGEGIDYATGYSIPRRVAAILLDTIDKIIITADYNQLISTLLPSHLDFLGAWNAQTNGTTNIAINAVSFGSNPSTQLLTYVAVGDNGTVLTSINGGETWNVIIVNSNNLNGIAYSSQTALFVAVGDNGTILSSPNGTTWFTQDSTVTTGLNAICSGPSGYVVVGDAGQIVTSPDGVIWTDRGLIGTNDLNAVCFGNQYIAVGDFGTIFNSVDGINWVSSPSNVTINLLSIAYNGANLYVTTAQNGKILSSMDGITWFGETTPTTQNLNAITFNGNSFFTAVGDLGVILTSTTSRVFATVGPLVSTGNVPYFVTSFLINSIPYFVAVNNDDATFSTYYLMDNVWIALGSPVGTGNNPRAVSSFYDLGIQYVIISNGDDDTFSTFSLSGDTWTAVGSPVATGAFPNENSVFSYNGIIYAVICNVDDNTFSTYSFTGTSWSGVGSAVSTGNGPIGIVTYIYDDVPYAAIVNQSSNNFFVFSFDGSTWTQITNLMTGNSPTQIAMFMSNNIPHLSICNKGDNSFSTFVWNGSSFIPITLSTVSTGIEPSGIISFTDPSTSNLYLTIFSFGASEPSAFYTYLWNGTNFVLIDGGITPLPSQNSSSSFGNQLTGFIANQTFYAVQTNLNDNTFGTFSFNGIFWETQIDPDPALDNLYGVTYGSQYIAVGADGTVLNSNNAILWNLVSPQETIVPNVGQIGQYYTVIVAGMQDLGNGLKQYNVGDMVFYGTNLQWDIQVPYHGIAYGNEESPIVPIDFVDGLFPAGFGYLPNTSYTWSIDSVNLTLGQDLAATSTYIVVHPSCPSGNIGDSTDHYVFIVQGSLLTAGMLMSPLSKNTPLGVLYPDLICNTEISVSGGVCSVGPFLFAYGNNGIIYNSDQNNPTKWAAVDSYAWQINPGLANTVNISNAKIVKGINFHGSGYTYAALFWSLDSVIMATFTGAPNVWTYTIMASNITIIAPNSVVERYNIFYWIGDGRFFVFNGRNAEEVPNMQNRNWFFENVTPQSRIKIQGFINPEFSEIVWLVPMNGSMENNYALVFNYESGCWYDYQLDRGAACYSPFLAAPILTSNILNPINKTYEVWIHETGVDQINKDGSATAIEAYFTTPDIGFMANTIMVANGKSPYGLIGNYQEILRVEPDFVGNATWYLSFFGRKYPNSALFQSAPSPFTTTTEKIDILFSDRIIQLNVYSNTVGADFYQGDFMITLNVSDAMGM